jgi:hypothetical protein
MWLKDYANPLANVPIGMGLSALLGAIGGALMPGPCAALQAFFGFFLASPVGLLFGCLAAVLRWPHRTVIMICTLQFTGAVIAAFAFYDEWRPDIGPTLLGQLVGAGLGVVYALLFAEPVPLVGQCPRCGYSLRGLSTMRCPECGTPFANNRSVEVESSESKDTADRSEQDDKMD